MLKKKVKRGLIITTCIIAGIIILAIAFISPLTKYLIEKYDEKYTGRQIELDWAYVNPLTGFIYLKNFKVYEHKSDSLFINSSSLSLGFDVLKMLKKDYVMTELTFRKPRIVFIQNKDTMNISDIILKFTDTADIEKKEKKDPVRFSLEDIEISDGEFIYQEQVIPVKYSVRNLNIDTRGKKWDEDSMSINFSFSSGTGTGDAEGILGLNTENKNYHLSTKLKNYNLDFIEQYVKDMARYGTFTANLDADILASGNFKDARVLNASGLLSLNDFHFGKSRKEDYLSFKKLVVDINALAPYRRIYNFDSISLSQPYFKFEKYDHLDNIQTMFGAGGENIKEAKQDQSFNLVLELANYVKLLAKNFFKSTYKINRLAVYDGNLRYEDYSLGEKFAVGADPLYIIADSIANTKNRVKLKLFSGIKPYGDFNLALSINPRDSSDFDINYSLQRMPLPSLNPYLLRYTSFPLDRGTLEVNGSWHVRNGQINSLNHIIMVDTRTGFKKKNKGNKWIPMPLIIYFVNERGNAVDYEVPIKGNLNDPKFKVRDVILDILENLAVKPISSPYLIKVRQLEDKVDKYLSITWQLRNGSLSDKQQTFVKRLNKFMQEHPEASIFVDAQNYSFKEKEYIAFFEAKKRYYLSLGKIKKSLSEDDSIAIERLSVKDSGFVQYLNKKINNPLVYTVQEKCVLLLGQGFINKKYAELLNSRKNMFMEEFRINGVDKRVKFTAPSATIPYNGFSFYKIRYKGALPQELIDAYNEMYELNNEVPRKRFKGIREKIRKFKTRIEK